MKKLVFKPEMFTDLLGLRYDAAKNAQSIFDEWLESQKKVYGFEERTGGLFLSEQQETCDTEWGYYVPAKKLKTKKILKPFWFKPTSKEFGAAHFIYYFESEELAKRTYYGHAAYLGPAANVPNQEVVE